MHPLLFPAGPTTLILPSSAAPPVTMQQPSLAPPSQAVSGGMAATGMQALPAAASSLQALPKLMITFLQNITSPCTACGRLELFALPACVTQTCACYAAGFMLPQQRAPATQSQPGQPQQATGSQAGSGLTSFAQMVMGHMPGQPGSQPPTQTGLIPQQMSQPSAVKQEHALGQLIPGLSAPQQPQQQQPSAATPHGTPATGV